MSLRLVVDQGNTRLKMAVFEQKKMLEQAVFPSASFEEPTVWAAGFLTKKTACLFSTVAEPNEAFLAILKEKTRFFELSHAMPMPFRIGYRTPQTLGKDRIAAVAGLHRLFFGPKKGLQKTAALAIDCGTCIKIDLLAPDGLWPGGTISPGAAMRLDAMQHFTARLPRPDVFLPEKAFGDTTETALQNGALRGAAHEIEGFFRFYKKKWPALRPVLTGGDAELFSKIIDLPRLRVEPNLTLLGLDHLLQHLINKA